ncbi:MAG TPA: hypothetical protein VMI73_10925 [Trebonia sp.]|nr:hypothetical protein [Trebonia sp.]
MSGNPLPAVRVAAESVVQMGKAIHRLSRIIRSADGDVFFAAWRR